MFAVLVTSGMTGVVAPLGYCPRGNMPSVGTCYMTGGGPVAGGCIGGMLPEFGYLCKIGAV